MCSKADWNNPQTSCKLCWNALFFAKQSAGREPKKVCSTFYRLHIYAEDREQQQQQTIKKKIIKLIAQATIFHIEYF